MRRLLRRFADDERGAFIVEMSLYLPVLVTILLGCFEATRYVLINQKLDRVASSTADLVAQSNGVSEAEIADLFSAADEVAAPFDLPGHGRVVVSSLTRPGAPAATVAWQRLSSGTLGVTSHVGGVGATATLPAGFQVRTNENVIVAEAFYDFHPFFAGDSFGTVTLYHQAMNRPRVINLTQVNP